MVRSHLPLQFWPWVKGKAERSSTYFGKQHFRSANGEHIGSPRDGVPRDSQDAATDTIPDNEVALSQCITVHEPAC